MVHRRGVLTRRATLYVRLPSRTVRAYAWFGRIRPPSTDQRFSRGHPVSTRPVVSAEPREVVGKKVSHLRRDGILPAVVYGAGQESQNIQLDAREFDALPLLARGAALRFLLTRAFDWLNTAPDAFVKPHDPIEYLRRLRFHQSITSASEYGIGDVRSA